jgi:hypothetical protein
MENRMLPAEQPPPIEIALGRAQLLQAKLESRLLVSSNDPVLQQKLKLDLQDVETEIARLIAELEKQAKPGPTSTISRRLRVYLGYWAASNPTIKGLYQHLQADGFEPWLEDEDLLFLNNRWREIERALKSSDVVLIFLTAALVGQWALFQDELKLVLAAKLASSQPEEGFFVVNLDGCTVPEELKSWSVFYFLGEASYAGLVKFLQRRAAQVGLRLLPPAYHEERCLDAALPSQVVKGEQTELVTMIRLASSEGLARLLRERPDDFVAKPENVKSADFELEFTQNERGGLNPLDLWIVIQPSRDFEVAAPRKKIRLQPAEDSRPFVFLLTALRLGELRLSIDICLADETVITSSLLRVKGAETAPSEPPETVLVTLPIGTYGVSSAPPSPVTTHAPDNFSWPTPYSYSTSSYTESTFEMGSLEDAKEKAPPQKERKPPLIAPDYPPTPGPSGPAVTPRKIGNLQIASTILSLVMLVVIGVVVFILFVPQTGSLFSFVTKGLFPSPSITGGTSDCRDTSIRNSLQQAYQQNPNDFVSLMNWGNYNLNCVKDYPTAITVLKQAVAVADGSTGSAIPSADRREAYYKLGLAYLYNQNNQQAEEQFNRVLKENPKDTSALLALSMSLSKNDPAKAQTYLQQILQIAPADSSIAAQARALLEDLKTRTPGN